MSLVLENFSLDKNMGLQLSRTLFKYLRFLTVASLNMLKYFLRLIKSRSCQAAGKIKGVVGTETQEPHRIGKFPNSGWQEIPGGKTFLLPTKRSKEA